MKRSLCALTVLLLAYVILAAPAPKPSLPIWDKPVDPDKDCKIRLGENSLTVEMPGTVHDFDLQAKRVNAPRLMRDFEGDFKIQVRVRIDCCASAESSLKGLPSYVSAGFLVNRPDNSYCFLRSEYRVEGQGDGVDGSVATKGSGRDRECPLKQFRNWSFTGKPDYFYQRLERWDNMLYCSISSDGKKWMPLDNTGLLGTMPTKVKVGLLACSTSTDPSKVRFDEIKIIPSKRDPWEFTSGWGKPVDPDKDCKIKCDKDSLTIEMPGSIHDYDPIGNRFNAPRLISDLQGRFDLQVRVRINYLPSAQSTIKGQPSFVSAGFLLIHPKELKYPYNGDICNRLEFAVSQQGSKPEAYTVAPGLAEPRRNKPALEEKDADSYAVWKTWRAGIRLKGNKFEWDLRRPVSAFNSIWERGWQNWPLAEKAEYTYLRLDHRDKWSCFYISPDGKKWTRLNFLHSLPKEGKLALAAYSTSTEPSKVRFDKLKLARYE